MNNRLKPYEEYKDSKNAFLDQVPNNWVESKFYTLTKPKSVINNTNEELLSVFLNNGVIKYSETSKMQVHKPSDDMSKYQLVENGDLVLNNQQAWRGSVGVSKYRGIVSPAYYVFEFSDIVNPRFANYSFRDSSMVDQFVLASKGVGSIQRNLYYPYLKYSIVCVPPKKEQDQIVRYLDSRLAKINKFIKNKKKLIELLKEQKQAIINQAVTKGLDPNVKMKPSGIEWLSDIPEGWEINKLGYIGRFQNGVSESGSFFESGSAFVSYGDVYNSIQLPSEVKGVANSSKKQQKIYSVINGDVFFTRTSETIDEIGLASVCLETIEDAVFSGFVIRFRPFNNKLDKNFSKYYFRNNKIREFFTREMNIVTRASLSQTLLRNAPAILPSLKEQEKISQFLETKTEVLDKAIEHIKNEIYLITEYRVSLISSVVTGKVDVRNIEVEDVTEVFEEPEDLDEEILDEELMAIVEEE